MSGGKRPPALPGFFMPIRSLQPHAKHHRCYTFQQRKHEPVNFLLKKYTPEKLCSFAKIQYLCNPHHNIFHLFLILDGF